MKCIRPDSKTSLLRISTHIYMINNMLGNLNKCILTNNKSNIPILNLMKQLLLLILLLELYSININKINRRFIIVNIKNNMERRRMKNKKLLINWRVYKRIKNKKNKNNQRSKMSKKDKNNKKSNMKKNNKNNKSNIWNNNKINKNNKINNLNRISLMNSPRWESRK